MVGPPHNGPAPTSPYRSPYDHRLTGRRTEELGGRRCQRHRRWTNEHMHAYQQSNKISPPSAADCMRSVLAMIASTSTTA
jgi:hypothetical protein